MTEGELGGDLIPLCCCDVLSGKYCQGNVREFWGSLLLWTLLTHICVTWHQWVNPCPPLTAACVTHSFILLHDWTALAINTLRPRRNGQHFTDNIFKRIFFIENVWISIKISLKFVPKVRIDNIPALVQIMAWRRPGDKPLSEPMMVRLPTHIYVTRPQWVNTAHN